MDSVVLGTSFTSWSFGSLTYKMNFVIQQFAHVVVTSAKCLTQGLEDSNFSLRGQKWCVRGGWSIISVLGSCLSWSACGSLTTCSQLSIHRPGPVDRLPGLGVGHQESRLSWSLGSWYFFLSKFYLFIFLILAVLGLVAVRAFL